MNKLCMAIAVLLVLMIVVCSRESFSQPSRKVFLHYANWCPHCKRMQPVWEAVKRDCNGQSVTFVEINEELKPTPGITSYPTILLVDTYGKLHKYIGGPNFDSLKRFVMAPNFSNAD